MTEPKVCTLCGAALPPEAPEGLCPNCLLKVALEPQSQAPASTAAAPKAGFTPPTPQQLNPHFPQLEFLELLGKGGMGAVYKARQKSLDRLVAVKILPPDVGLDPAFAERFTREARALAKLSHPHIVGVHDFGQVTAPLAPLDGAGWGDGPIYYFIMEFVDGVNVRQALRAGQLKPAEALQIVPRICDALQYAHEEGVVHRDIKPENILLDKRGRVKIADFGLAKLIGKTPEDLTLTGTQQIVGTVPYMAPEQIEGAKDIDHRADIYSLGVTFYEMLTGTLPLGRFPVPSKKVQIDVRLDEVVLRTLEKEPELRYQQAGQVRDDVESISRTPAGKPMTAVLQDVAGQVLHRGKKAAGWVADKVGRGAAEIKRAVEPAAPPETAAAAPGVAEATPATAAPPAASANETGGRKRLLLLLGLAALAIVGVIFDLRHPHVSLLGTFGALVPLALIAWKTHGTDFGRQAKLWLFWLLAAGIALQMVVRSTENVFIAAIVLAIAYLVWDKLRSWWRRPKTVTVAAEKQG